MNDPTPENSLLEMVAEVLRDVFDRPDLQVHESLSHHDVATWDSFSHITLVVALEETFAVEFDGEEIAALTDVAAILGALQRHGADGHR